MNITSILKIAKYFVIVFLFFIAIKTIVQLCYNITYPILPETFVESVKNKEYSMMITHYEGIALQSLGILLYLLSFFVIGFKCFRNKNIFTRILLSLVLVIAFCLIVVWFANSVTKEKIYLYILLAIPPIIGLGILLKYGYKKVKPKNEKGPSYQKVDVTEDGFIFKTIHKPIILNNPYRGIYVQGGAGSGKSVSVFEPIIQQIAKKEYSGILYDFKSPELTKKLLFCYKEQTKIKPYFIDFKNPYISNRCNPIAPQYMPKGVHALEFSSVLLNNMLPETIKNGFDFWTGGARMILAGTMIYLKNNFPYYCSLPHVISLILLSDSDKLINEISTDNEAAGLVSSLKGAIEREAEKQVAGVLSTLQNALSQLYSPDLFWILSKDDLNLDLNNKENPKFLCIGNDSTLSSTYAPIISLIISSSLKQMNQPNKQRSIVLLDEAPTLYIPNIEQIPATARSNKVSVVFGVQDYSQLADKYGKEKAEIILSNLGNQFYGRTVNIESAKKIKELFGKEDRLYKTKNTGSGSSGEFIHIATNSNKGVSESIQERDRVNIQSITNLGAGVFYGLIAEGSPNEFLNTQLKPSEINGEFNFPILATEEQIRNNYNRIIEEAKSIL